MESKLPTRDKIWQEIQQRHHQLPEQLSAWSATEVIGKIPQEEWDAAHRGTCGLCGADGARLYPTGWRCMPCTGRTGAPTDV